ncbi:MAG: helix-turn-helix transcriptional regulator [Bacilli bacterium]|nr:helix-turn-helix transcriptional regulator [Bacilli bacterium]
MNFGENLKQIRKSKNMSQEELAQKVNVTRQSVSKWENGEAYPEMNNILELCKIFNCKINDLVHADMSDISSIDKEIVMSAVQLNEKKQNEMKVLSNIIEMIAKIGSIVLKVAIPFVLLAMILVPIVVSNVKVSDNEIAFKTGNIKIIDDREIVINGVAIGKLDDSILGNDIVELFKNNSKVKIISYVESAMIFVLLDIIIILFILDYVRKLFENIKNNTLFTLDNVQFIKKISYLMIALILVSPISSVIIEFLADVPMSEDSPFELIGILEILIIFSMSYVFEYGYELQKNSKNKIINS